MMLQKRLQGSRAAGGTDGCADAENIAAKGLGSKTGPRVCGEIGRSDHEFEAKQARIGRGFLADRSSRTVGKWQTDTVNSQLRG